MSPTIRSAASAAPAGTVSMAEAVTADVAGDVPDLTQYPGIPLAYDYVRPSYELVARRFEAVEGRLRAVLGIAATLTLAAPVFIAAVAGHRDPLSPWFLLAAGLFILVLIVGGFGLRSGDLWLLNPNKLYDQTLHLDDLTFKQHLLAWAGEDFERNVRLVRRTAWCADGVIALLLLELACLVGWAISPS